MPKFVADSSVSPTGLKWAVDPVADVVTTAGDLIYGTAADTVARLGIGTAGQVLKVNSGATAPEWGAVAGGGGLVLLNSGGTTLSGSSVTISFTPTDYTNLFIVIRNPVHSGAGAFVYVDINGSNTANKGYYAGEATFAGGSTGWLSSSGTGDLFYGAYADGSNLETIIIGTIYDINNTTTYKVADYKFARNSPYLLTGQALWAATSAVSSLKFAISSGTFASGTVYVYGVK